MGGSQAHKGKQAYGWEKNKISGTKYHHVVTSKLYCASFYFVKKINSNYDLI
jgi:hypothetical protein